MDSSMQYITMCKKATELQETVKTNLNRLECLRYYLNESGDIEHIFLRDDMPDLEDINTFTILFTQEQLQEHFNSQLPPIDTLERITFVWKWEKGYWSLFESFEQLWLAFLMKERYKKIWNNEKENWVDVIK